MRLCDGIEWHVRDVDVQGPQGQLHPRPAELRDAFVRMETVMGMREVLEPCLQSRVPGCIGLASPTEGTNHMGNALIVVSLHSFMQAVYIRAHVW